MLTPETITRHELIGLPVSVAAADSDAHAGTAGRVVGETTRTLLVRTRSGDERVPKAGTTFEFDVAARPSARLGGVDSIDGTAGSSDNGGGNDDGSDDGSGGEATPRTDEAAGDRKAPGGASELGSDTAGVRPRQSVPSGPDGPASRRGECECEGATYVTVDGARLLSRPADRSRRGGPTWR